MEMDTLPAKLKKPLCVAVVAAFAGIALGDSVPAGTVADIVERTKPFGELCLEGEDCGGVDVAEPVAAPAGRSGAEVYTTFCRTCHETGLQQAPVSGDLAAWATRLEKGMDELVRTSREGINLMPPMGACMQCTDDELRAAIEYMTAEPDEE